ncbi:MAG: immunoglobulin domain-containing protein, partial [Opitutaceae bacterium]|nr:immunoglobulin domain-containing protein [Opitutaceae bacterium]
MSLRRLLSLALACACAVGARAFVYLEGFPAWPDGAVTLELQLGNSPTYSDGTTPNSTAIQAIGQWNPSMSRVQFGYVNNSGAAKSRTNGKNNVFFDSKIFGTAFPEGVLAVTTGRAEGGKPAEMDVVVNTAWQWDSYRGYLQYPKIDLRRVLAHEFGHVLGLDHPDERGQWAYALMNAYISEIEGTQQDDKDGASYRYGYGPGNPLRLPVFQPDAPYDVTALPGSYVTLEGYVTGSEPMTLQWLKDGQAIAGATTRSLSFPIVARTDAGRYILRATNPGGTVSSREAVLTVPEPLPPTIVEHPQSKSVTHSGSFGIGVAASSNAPITFQWTKDGVAIPGATASTYGRQNVQPSDAGVYRVIATTGGGSTTSNGAVITVLPAAPPVITEHPLSIGVEEGEPATFSVGLHSEIPLTFQWMRNGVAIPGATHGSLRLDAVRLADAGSYHVIVTNVGGSAVSQPATLAVQATQLPSIVQHPGSVAAEAGTRAYFSVTASSRVAMTYQWTRDGSAIAGATDSWFALQAVTTADAATYRVVVTNSAGSVTSQPAVLVVAPPRPPEFYIQPNGGSAEVGGHVYLSAHVRSTTPVTFQWTHNGVNVPGATGPEHYIVYATEAQSGTYRLRATNAAGSVWSDEATVTITQPKPPRFSVHPFSQTVEQGVPLGLSCIAQGGAPITYQWYRNGNAIAGATGQSYLVASAAAADAGDYVVRATNPAGTSTSETATVTVIP